MNNYPIWWQDTITVYNKYTDASTKQITWYKTVLYNCFWKYSGEKVLVGQTVLDSNNAVCRVPKNVKFKEKYEWEALTNKAGYFTFAPGDIVVRGICQTNINEYQSGSRSTDLIKAQKDLRGCFTVEKCAINVGLGRGNEHYYVRGI